MKRVLILISECAEDLVFAREVALACELEFIHLQHGASLSAFIEQSELVVLLCDCAHPALDQFEAETQGACGSFPQKISPNAISYIVSPKDFDRLQSIPVKLVGGNFIIRKYGENPGDAAFHYARVIRVLTQKNENDLLSHMAIGSPILTCRFDSSSQKLTGVKAAEKFILDMGGHPRVASVVANAMDELLMNAIFDAPNDSSGNQIYAKTPRSEAIVLANDQYVDMQIGMDDQYIGLSVTDHCGTLRRDRVLKHVVKVVYEPCQESVSAGVGLSLVFRSGASFFFQTEAGVSTTVSVFFKRTQNFRDFQSQFQFVSTQIHSVST